MKDFFLIFPLSQEEQKKIQIWLASVIIDFPVGTQGSCDNC